MVEFLEWVLCSLPEVAIPGSAGREKGPSDGAGPRELTVVAVANAEVRGYGSGRSGDAGDSAGSEAAEPERDVG